MPEAKRPLLKVLGPPTPQRHSFITTSLDRRILRQRRRSNEMFRRLILSISSIVVFELCAAAQTKPPATPAEPPKQEEEAPSAMTVPPTYKFQLRGRRDPFINPVPKPAEQKQAAVPADR